MQRPIFPKDYKATVEAQVYQRFILNHSVVLPSFPEARLCPLSQDSLLACFYIRTFFSAAMHLKSSDRFAALSGSWHLQLIEKYDSSTALFF
jgi:hypothetical protein